MRKVAAMMQARSLFLFLLLPLVAIYIASFLVVFSVTGCMAEKGGGVLYPRLADSLTRGGIRLMDIKSDYRSDQLRYPMARGYVVFEQVNGLVVLYWPLCSMWRLIVVR